MAKKRKHKKRVRQIKWRWAGLAARYCKTKRAFTKYEMKIFAIRRDKELNEAFKHIPPYNQYPNGKQA